MSTPMLRVRGLVTAYGKIEALKGVSLDVAHGGVTCILGPNGAGKTTLMMTLAGILHAKAGEVTFEGKQILNRSTHTIVQAGVALVPENRLVFPAMTVLENLRAGAYLRRDRQIDADLERSFVRFPKLRERARQVAGTLSGGEQQMLAVARALMARPRLLLMDEPSLGLAPMVVHEIFGFISELNAEGTTILLVEQNAHMALRVAGHFYLMDQGRVVHSGASSAMSEDDIIQRAYLGSLQ